MNIRKFQDTQMEDTAGRIHALMNTPRYDIELFDAFEAGRLEPKNEDQREWYEAVKAGRLEAK